VFQEVYLNDNCVPGETLSGDDLDSKMTESTLSSGSGEEMAARADSAIGTPISPADNGEEDAKWRAASFSLLTANSEPQIRLLKESDSGTRLSSELDNILNSPLTPTGLVGDVLPGASFHVSNPEQNRVANYTGDLFRSGDSHSAASFDETERENCVGKTFNAQQVPSTIVQMRERGQSDSMAVSANMVGSAQSASDLLQAVQKRLSAVVESVNGFNATVNAPKPAGHFSASNEVPVAAEYSSRSDRSHPGSVRNSSCSDGGLSSCESTSSTVINGSSGGTYCV